MAVKPVSVPKGLRMPGAALWRAIAKQWADDGLVPDAREVRLLTDACREADILALLEDELSKANDLVVKGSMGQPVTHPHVAETRRSRAQVASLLLKLGFTDGSAKVRPAGGPMTTAEAGRKGGFMKHYGNGTGGGARG